MKISKSQFEEELEKNTLTLSIIGMSNIGKTLWSKHLSKIGFNHICCDDLIEDKLEPELKALGYKGLQDIAKWLGHPYEERFTENQKLYLALEIETMKEILNQIKQKSNNTVIDTTGSVIYTGENICSAIKAKSLVIYIESSKKMKDKMFNNFLKHPKPIVWGDSYQRKNDETNKVALARCYPDLLAYRSRLYEKYADLKIPAHKVDSSKIDTDEFLQIVKNHL